MWIKVDKWFFLFSLLIFIYFLNMKPLSEVAPCLLDIQIQIQIQAVCSKITAQRRGSYFLSKEKEKYVHTEETYMV